MNKVTDATGYKTYKTGNGKRRLIKSLLGGAGVVAGGHIVPDSWIKPVFSTASVPAHANTSCAFFINNVNLTRTDPDSIRLDYSLEFDPADEFDGRNVVASVAGIDEGTDFVTEQVIISADSVSDEVGLETEVDNDDVGTEYEITFSIERGPICVTETVLESSGS